MNGLPARYTRLGVDVGDARVGCARSDLDGMVATPVETFPRKTAARQIAAYAIDENARVIMLGLPKSLNGQEGAAAQKARDFADELAAHLPSQRLKEGADDAIHLRFVDERLTTVSAHRALTSSGRKMKKHRSVVDQVAAVMILQTALDQQRATGELPGELRRPADDPSRSA